MAAKVTIKKCKFKGLNAVELTTPQLKLVGITAFGPRIGFFGKPGDDNLLYWVPKKNARNAKGREVWNLHGGHRTWMAGIGADECEMTYNADNKPATLEVRKNGFRMTGAYDPENATIRGIDVTVKNNNSLLVDSFVMNKGDMLLGAAMWALTCSLPNDTTQYVIPIGDGSTWQSATMVLFNQWAGHGQKSFADDQYVAGKDAVVITPKGLENKRMIQSEAGIIAMTDPTRDITFAKKMDYRLGGKYPLNTNIAAYVGPKNFMVEMETMGEESTLKPGQELHHVETWTLTKAMKQLTGKAAIDLFK